MESRMTRPEAENLVQTNHALAIGGLTYALNPRGGTTGFPTLTECPSGYVAVGIHGREGSHVDRLGLLCRYLNADGSFGATYYAGAQGGFGGANCERVCPDGQVIVGFLVRSLNYVNSLNLQCAPPASWVSEGRVQGYSNSMGIGSGYDFNDRCPQSFVVTSLNVRVGDYVDQMQAVCSQLY
ncbi:hypothetical protein CYFUS_008957 [Cystobacter fuscus]|uniref:Jacalin-type lectin domain-containing protein n=2 Tax=Cystobacter fuscus TaxID=43 RepID=A0A250JJ22_9BACT|nr:hypothetical protein CYFUS_008957 [Cystobacter fuscus]